MSRRPSTSEATAPASGSRAVRKVAVAALIGTSIEWYDFFIYGLAAALVFAPQFFPKASPVAGTLAALGTFAVGFLARPIGGAIAGHFGDRIGRRPMLVVTLLLMGGASTLIGLLPTYAQIGVAAPVLLVTLRLLQGLAVGGEWGGAVLMATEHAPSGRRGWYGSFVQLGVPVGLVTSNLVFLLVSFSTSTEQFASWGWRIPFLLSAALVLVGLYVRPAGGGDSRVRGAQGSRRDAAGADRAGPATTLAHGTARPAHPDGYHRTGLRQPGVPAELRRGHAGNEP